MIEKAFFCENCRRPIDSVSQVLYVEDLSDRGFCSEQCIKDFYTPFMHVLEAEEESFRKELSLEEEDELLHYLNQSKLLQKILQYPDEVWFLKNDIDQKFYTHVKKIDVEEKEIYFILICSYIDDAPSFVFYRTLTKSMKLLEKYRREKLLIGDSKDEQEEAFSQEQMPQEIKEEVDLKKSVLLAELLALRADHDIPFEEFLDFDNCLQKTIHFPDEVYQFVDETGDDLLTYIRSFRIDEMTFFYIVQTMKREVNKKTYVVPILSFPSLDDQLYPHYARGEVVKRKVSN